MQTRKSDGSTQRTRRLVRLTERTAAKAWTKLWAYSYADLADLLGITEGSVRKAVAAGHFDPTDLHSICRFWLGGVQLPPGYVT